MFFPIVIRPVVVRPVATTSILSGNTFSTGGPVWISGNQNVVGSQAGNTVQR